MRYGLYSSIISNCCAVALSKAEKIKIFKLNIRTDFINKIIAIYLVLKFHMELPQYIQDPRYFPVLLACKDQRGKEQDL